MRVPVIWISIILIFVVVIVILSVSLRYQTSSHTSNTSSSSTDKPHKNTSYVKVGFLVSNFGEKPQLVLPLYGRNIPHLHDRYEYYTETDRKDKWKVSVQYQKRDCESANGQQGCAKIQDGSTVVIPVLHNKPFLTKITLDI